MPGILNLLKNSESQGRTAKPTKPKVVASTGRRGKKNRKTMQPRASTEIIPATMYCEVVIFLSNAKLSGGGKVPDDRNEAGSCAPSAQACGSSLARLRFTAGG